MGCMDIPSSGAAGYEIRPPRQARSAASWRRILDAGRSLVEEGGADALTLSALCERADVAPTTVYQRVDSMNGLMYAIFQDGMAGLDEFTSMMVGKAMAMPPRSPERIYAAMDAVGETFRQNTNFLRTITEYSVSDDAFWRVEDENANQLVQGVTNALTFGNEQSAHECAQLIFTLNMVRILFGSHWMGSTQESYEDFRERVFRMVWARLNFDA